MNDCVVCSEVLPKKQDINFYRLTCCGRGMHSHCHDDILHSDTTPYDAKYSCYLCRKPYVNDETDEDLKRLRAWWVDGRVYYNRQCLGLRDAGEKVSVWNRCETRRRNSKNIFWDCSTQGKRIFDDTCWLIKSVSVYSLLFTLYSLPILYIIFKNKKKGHSKTKTIINLLLFILVFILYMSCNNTKLL